MESYTTRLSSAPASNARRRAALSSATAASCAARQTGATGSGSNGIGSGRIGTGHGTSSRTGPACATGSRDGPLAPLPAAPELPPGRPRKWPNRGPMRGQAAAAESTPPHAAGLAGTASLGAPNDARSERAVPPPAETSKPACRSSSCA
eukprot:scaffold27300_cov65-Isochrysis_galbana.AAC.1